MIYALSGRLVHRDGQGLVVECAGVAWYCKASLSTLARLSDIGSDVTIYTHLQIRTDALDLFGFYDAEERSCFQMLTGVSGVGAKAALSILSSMTPEQFALCVASGDFQAITAAPGVGKKLSQRIVLELKDKISAADQMDCADLPAMQQQGGDSASEALSALVVLGYSRSQAASVLSRLDRELPVQELIKASLKQLAGK